MEPEERAGPRHSFTDTGEAQRMPHCRHIGAEDRLAQIRFERLSHRAEDEAGVAEEDRLGLWRIGLLHERGQIRAASAR